MLDRVTARGGIGEHMARAGDVIENPAMGARIVFQTTAADSGGQLLAFDFFLRPGGVIAKAHLHPRQEERFTVRSGRVRGRVDGRMFTAGPGDLHVTPPGTRHVWWNDSDEEAHLFVEFRPALATEALFEEIFRLAAEGKTNRKGLPSPLRMAVLLSQHEDEFYPASPPLPVVKAAVALAAPIGRLLGYGSRAAG